MKCKYNCGQEGKYQLKNGDWACSKYSSQCPEQKRKNSESNSKYIPNKSKSGNRTKNRIPWNKGKNKNIDIRLVNSGLKISESLKGNKNLGRGKTPEIESARIEKIRTAININYANGWQSKAGRCKKIFYTSNICGQVKLDGTWEKFLAEYFDSNNINWIRNTKRFKYYFENKYRWYTPDFYLVDFKCYVEVKGYETIKDKAKWSQFTDQLVILKKEEFNLFKKEKDINKIIWSDGGVGLSHFGANEAGRNVS